MRNNDRRRQTMVDHKRNNQLRTAQAWPALHYCSNIAIYETMPTNKVTCAVRFYKPQQPELMGSL